MATRLNTHLLLSSVGKLVHAADVFGTGTVVLLDSDQNDLVPEIRNANQFAQARERALQQIGAQAKAMSVEYYYIPGNPTFVVEHRERGRHVTCTMEAELYNQQYRR